jgi:hypothetical protein
MPSTFYLIPDYEFKDVYWLIVELIQPIPSEGLNNTIHKVYSHLVDEKIIKCDDIITISFIKHFDRNIKAMPIVSENNEEKAKKLHRMLQEPLANKRVLESLSECTKVETKKKCEYAIVINDIGDVSHFKDDFMKHIGRFIEFYQRLEK